MAGYRFIDTAFIYENEEAIGNALQELFKKGTIKREDIFVSTKVSKTWTKDKFNHDLAPTNAYEERRRRATASKTTREPKVGLRRHVPCALSSSVQRMFSVVCGRLSLSLGPVARA